MTRQFKYELAQLQAADYPVTEDVRCICVYIPAEIEHVKILAGLFAIASRTAIWAGTPEEREAHAAVWLKAFEMTDWDTCFGCDDVADCIETSENVQTQIRNVFGGSNPFTNHTVGEPLPESEYTADQTAGTNPTCDYDILWAQCLATVQYFNRAIIDVLERLEAATNVVEIIDALEELPIVKYVANITGVSTGIELIGYFQETLQEQYEAEYDTALENDLACALFCAARNDCQLSINTMFDVFSDRITSLIADPDAIGTLVDMVEVLAGLEFDSTIVVDLAMWVCAAGWKLGNFIFGEAADLSFEMLMMLAVNDASNDWLILCDCPECEITYEVTTGTENLGVITPAAQEELSRLDITGTAYGRRIIIVFDSPVVRVDFDFTWTGTPDAVIAKLGTGDTVIDDGNTTGSMTVRADTASDTLIIDSGYSEDPVYEFRYADISNVYGCTG